MVQQDSNSDLIPQVIQLDSSPPSPSHSACDLVGIEEAGDMLGRAFGDLEHRVHQSVDNDIGDRSY